MSAPSAVKLWRKNLDYITPEDLPKRWVGSLVVWLRSSIQILHREFTDITLGLYDGEGGLAPLEEFLATVAGTLEAEITMEESGRQEASLAGFADKASQVTIINSPEQRSISHTETGSRVFLVHGHDTELKLEVARFVEKELGLECIILHEQPNKGMTLIEKLLSHAEKADFAVALWTADDVGRAKTEAQSKPRARQNVVFETGFFLGGLGRARICVIHESGVELPSDWHGVTYVPIESWKEDLRRELKAAKPPVT